MNTDTPAGTAKLVGGRLCLDFANSAGGRIFDENADHASVGTDYTITNDKIKNYVDLVVWGRHAGLLSDKEAQRLARLAKADPAPAKAVYRRGLRLREAIFRIVGAAIDGLKPDDDDVAELNHELATANRHERLLPAADQFTWAWVDADKALDRVLWPVVKSAAEILTSDDLSRVRRCGGENCGWLFLDTSRNRSRHWCDMKDCGNLAKVRRFRERQREENS
ncbi:MAG TPA: CGNR zinc finger domain-containing protein [Pyrinomonadaceae bacterium]|nr:CGNR zinc finger domain-containing protein [Pyrinomonadaceae bacterium]